MSGALIFSFLVSGGICAPNAAEETAPGQAGLSAPQKDLHGAEKTVEESFSETAKWSELEEPAKHGAEQPSASQKPAAQRHARQTPRVEDSRNVAPGYNGYMGTYVDPANGDIVTSVIAPTNRNNQQQYQNYPIIVEPQVGGWGNSGWGNSNWDNSWNNPYWNNGWHGPGQQVPGYPWPPAQPGFQPSGQVPGYPWPPSPEGYGPPPPPPGGWANQGSYPPPGPGNNPPGFWPSPGPYPVPGGAPMPPPGTPPAPGQQPPNLPPNPGMRPPAPSAPPGTSIPATPLQPAFPNGNPGGIMPAPPNSNPQAPPNAPGYFPGHPGRPWGFGHTPGYGPSRRPQSGFPRTGMNPRGPRSALTPPRNPDRPGSMPLVAPNFPPHVETKPFVDLYRPPLARMPRKSASTFAERREEATPYYVPGSAQNWQPSNWQTGK